MNDIFIQAIKVTRNKRIRQVGTLFSSMLLGIAFSIGITVVNTRFLGYHHYGDLKFLQALFNFIVVLLTLGLFISGSRLLAQKKYEKMKHQLIGNLLILASCVSLVLTVFVYIFSFFEEDLFNNELSQVIRIFSPFLFVFPFQFCLENIMQGDRRIYELSIFRSGPKALYLMVAIPFNWLVPLSLTSVLTIHIACLALLILIMVFRFKPKFVDIRYYSSLIFQETKTYGFPVYLGVLANVGTTHLSGLSIGYFIDNTNVGFYSLAVAVTTPLSMLSSSIGTTLYKDFANRNFIPKKITAATLTLSICSLLIFLLTIKKVILMLYSIEYIAVVPLAYLISVGSIFRGLGDYFNRFLGSHGRGKELRNCAFANGLSNVFGYIFLVFFFGVKGAAVTRVISDFIYWCIMYNYYKKYVLSLFTKNN